MTGDTSFINDLLATLYVRVKEGLYMECTANWINTDYFPDYYRIYYVTEGEGWVRIGNEDIFLRKGELYWLPSNINQQYALTNLNNPLKHYWVHFYATVGSDMPLNNIIKIPYSIKILNETPVIELFKNLHRSLNNPSGIDDFLIVKSSMLSLMAYFINSCRNDIKTLRTPVYEELKPVIDYIEENLSRNISLNQLAGVICLHPNYFSKKFHKYMGVSPMEYLMQKRIKKAKTLLTRSNKQICDIAAEVGYIDQFQFSNIFKKHTNISPTEYRNAYKII